MPKVPCDRCDGAGFIARWAHINKGICLKCGGNKVIDPKRRKKGPAKRKKPRQGWGGSPVPPRPVTTEFDPGQDWPF